MHAVAVEIFAPHMPRLWVEELVSREVTRVGVTLEKRTDRESCDSGSDSVTDPGACVMLSRRRMTLQSATWWFGFDERSSVMRMIRELERLFQTILTAESRL